MPYFLFTCWEQMRDSFILWEQKLVVAAQSQTSIILFVSVLILLKGISKTGLISKHQCLEVDTLF